MIEQTGYYNPSKIKTALKLSLEESYSLKNAFLSVDEALTCLSRAKYWAKKLDDQSLFNVLADAYHKIENTKVNAP